MESKESVVNKTITLRHDTHGTFVSAARISRNIKRAFYSSRNWHNIPDDMAEALDMVANKIGRILDGDFNHVDHWVDLSGYPTLIVKRLKGDEI